MDITFEWHSNVPQEARESIESRFKSSLSTYVHFTPCHDGPLLVVLDCLDDLNETLSGKVKCSCGTLLATIVGKYNGSATNLAHFYTGNSFADGPVEIAIDKQHANYV